MRYFLLSLIFICVAQLGKSQTTLAAGDIAFVSYNLYFSQVSKHNFGLQRYGYCLNEQKNALIFFFYILICIK